MKTWIVIVLGSCLTLSCATPQGTSAVECGAGGAVGGYALCKLLGGDDRKCLSVAILAGGVGGSICYVYAGNLERRRQQLAGKENDLDARLRYVRGVNDDTESLNHQLRDRVAQVTQHTDEVVARIGQGRVTQEQLARERETLDTEVKTANQQLALGKKSLEEMKRYQQAQSARDSRALDSEVARQERLLAETQRQTTALASQRLRI